ncbi:hypothetical protein Tco_1247122 [Tanacetum coccineum]
MLLHDKTIVKHNLHPLLLPLVKPSPTPIIPDSIPETSGGNLGGHSSSDKSLSGNEGDMTLQRITKLKKQAKLSSTPLGHGFKLLLIVSKDSQEELLKKHWVAQRDLYQKQGRKVVKGEYQFKEISEIDEIRLSTEYVVSTDKEVVSTDKEKVSTDKEKVSTDRPIVSTDGSKVSTDRQIEGTDETIEGTEEHIEGTEEHIEGTEEQVESTDGQRKGTEDHTEEEIAAQATQTPTQTHTSTILEMMNK